MNYFKISWTIGVVLYLLIFLTSFTAANAQKVKYKDLFPLLDAKKYEDAEPFLKTFLLNEPDHANANFQMGLLFQAKAEANDVVEETEKMAANIDTAVLYFQKAKTLIDDKEVRKRDEYYQEYNRRDLRTGKFGIKLSDVQLDIDQRIGKLKERAKLGKEMARLYDHVVANYERARRLYNELQSNYVDVYQIYLGSEDDVVDKLTEIANSFDSSQYYLDKFQKLSAEMEDSGYDLEIVKKDINSFALEGKEKPDFSSENLTLWNYSDWAEKTIIVYEQEATPLKEDLLAYHEKLSSIEKRIEEVDTTLTSEKLPGQFDSELTERLTDFQNDPFLVPFMEFRVVELNYLFRSNPELNTVLKDSFDIDRQLKQSKMIVLLLSDADSLLSKMDKEYELDIISQRYNKYLKDPENFEASILDKKYKYFKAKTKWEENLEFWSQKGNWAYYQGDSIPIFVVEDSLERIAEAPKYETLAINNSDSAIYTAGIMNIEGKNMGFIAKILPSREVDWLSNLNMAYVLTRGRVDSLNMKLLSTSREYKILFAYAKDRNAKISQEIASTTAQERQHFGVIAKFNDDGKIAWDKNLNLKGFPEIVEYDDLVHETKIYLHNGQDIYKYILVDKNGNVR